MKAKKQLQVKYSYVDCEQSERQRRLDDAFDVIFDQIEMDAVEDFSNKNEYEQPAIIKR